MHRDLYEEGGMVYNCLGFEPYPMYCPRHSKLNESERTKLKKNLSS